MSLYNSEWVLSQLPHTTLQSAFSVSLTLSSTNIQQNTERIHTHKHNIIYEKAKHTELRHIFLFVACRSNNPFLPKSTTHADMKSDLPLILKPILLFLLVSLSLFAFISLQTPHQSPLNPTTLPPDLKIRPGYSSYDAYLQRQLNKTLNPKLREIWTTRDWARKVEKFSEFFANLKQRQLLFNASKALSIGARVGQEVAALKRVGVEDSVGIDLVPYPPLVIKGDFHHQPFDDATFDFEFSNVFDHALYPWKFIGEVERTLKAGGICVLHVLLSRRADKYSANDLYSVKPLEEMFKNSELIEVRSIDGFGLDTEVVFRKNKN